MVTATVAFDESVRSIDESGHLRVARTIISKAQVDPYMGREIPDYDLLGLDPDKVYHLLRDPAELEKAAPTFKGKQLLLKHVYVDAKTPEKDLTVGAVGSSVEYDGGKLYADLTFWDEQAISLIESEKMKELSSSYYYTADMTPGEYEGQAYDGIIRDIHGNHVALVERGRIGRDAVISDSLPFEMRSNMKLKKGAVQLITARLRKIAQDEISDEVVEDLVREVVDSVEEKIDDVVDDVVDHEVEEEVVVGKPAFDEARLRELAGDNYEEIVKLIGGHTADDEDRGPKAEAERKRLEETDRDDRDAKREAAMDADSIAAAVEAKINAKYAARDAVEPLVGRIALDGFTDAKSIYAYALKKRGVATDGVNEAGLRALVAMQRSAAKTAPVAMDSAPSDLTKRFKRGF